MVSTMRLEELEQRLQDLRPFLTNLGKGEGPKERYDLYIAGGKARFNLDANCPMGKFNSEHHELICSTLAVMFVDEFSPDYVCKVILPEAMIKIYMDVVGCEYAKAEMDLFDINLSQQTDVSNG